MVIIDTMMVYHFADPNLGVEMFSKKGKVLKGAMIF